MTRLTRRDFLKLLVTAAAVPVLQKPVSLLDRLNPGAKAEKPNILILVYDTLAAEHLSVYGYPRETTPNLDRFASQSTVFHAHYAAGNFTTTGTASLLTGVYPWTHRAFNIAAPVDASFEKKNLFSLFSGDDYYKVAYTHNLLADYFLHQFGSDIHLHLDPRTFFLLGTPGLDQIFRGDRATAYRSSNYISRILDTERIMPGSLFLSLLNEMGLEQYEATFDARLAALFPDGLPEEGNSKSFFILEQAIDGMVELLQEVPQPFLMYFHLYPPHHPYHPRREFIGRYRDDGWAPIPKETHFFTSGQTNQDLNERRIKYDEYLAYADSEFGRLASFLQAAGLMENTLVLFTSDHGEMFERGIKGHNAPVLFNPLVRVPLLIHKPGQKQREDVFTATSCTDVLPSLAAVAGMPAPDWGEGFLLPTFTADEVTGSPPSTGRRIFSLDARQNSRFRSLKVGTVSMIKDQHKLIAYFGFRGFDQQYELYDLENDPQELNNIYRPHQPVGTHLIDELQALLGEVNHPFPS